MHTLKFYSTAQVPCTYLGLMERRIKMRLCSERLFSVPWWVMVCFPQVYVIWDASAGKRIVCVWLSQNNPIEESAHDVLLSFPYHPSSPPLISFPLISFTFLSLLCTMSSSPFFLATYRRISGSSSLHFHRHCFSITTPFCTTHMPDTAAVGFCSSASTDQFENIQNVLRFVCAV